MAVVLLGMAGVAFWDDSNIKKEKEIEKTKDLVASFEKNDISTIRYKRSTEKEQVSLSVIKKDNDWRMLEPFGGTLADKDTIERLLNAFHSLKHSSEVTSSKDMWVKYGLDENKNKIAFESQDGTQTTFVLGSKSPIGYNMYLGVLESSKVFFVSQTIEAAAAKKLLDFRNKSIADFDINKLTELRLLTKTTWLHAKKAKDNKWTIEKNKKVIKAADEFSVKNIAIAINNEKAIAILSLIHI